MAQYPVCHMDVDPVTAQHRAEYEGTTHYFCSRMCRQAFEDNPQQYLEGQQQPAS